MDDSTVRMMIQAIITIVTQFAGYQAIVRKLDSKTDKKEYDSLEKRVIALEAK